MNTRYNVAIISCGEAGISAGCELICRNSGLKVVILDQGADIYTRSCPIVVGKVKECIHCEVRDTICGFGGVGVFSDGKYNFTTALGGWFTDFIPRWGVMELVDYVGSTNMRYEAVDQVLSTETPIVQALEKKALEYDLHPLQARCKHLDTENNLKILQNIYKEMRQGAEFRLRVTVTKIGNLGKEGYRLTTDKGNGVNCTRLIAGPGCSGAEWPSDQCKELDIRLINNQVDISVRVELPTKVFEHTIDAVYESKLVYRAKQYGGQVRTFCMNPYGHVVVENVEGTNAVNDHSYFDPKLCNENTNLALLVPSHPTSPFSEPYCYGKYVTSLSNMLAGDVLVQHFGDPASGIRTNEHHMSKFFVHPTLIAAVPGDLSLALPRWQSGDIIEMIYQLDKLAPDTANYDTLLYSAGVKFYSARLALSSELEATLPGFFVVNDNTDVARGPTQADTSGMKATRVISERLK